MRILKRFFTHFLPHPAAAPAAAPAPAEEGERVMDAVSRLAGGIAHDLNNILLVVQGYAEMALAEKDAGPETRAHVAEVRDAAARASALVADLLLVGRRSSFMPRPLDMNEALAPLLPALQARAGIDVQVRFLPAEHLPAVMADADQLGRIVSALCARSCEAMPGGGSIELRTMAAPATAAGPGRVLLKVSDTGPGIDGGLVSHLFEPYFSETPGGKGYGLRLSLVHGIVKRFDGDLDVQTGAGAGTTFVVSLPARGEPANGRTVPAAARQESPVPVEAPAARPAAAGSTILVAEDDDSLRVLATKILTREGFTVLAARDGQEAVEIFERRADAIRLVLLDDVMPRMGGRAALSRMRQRAPGLPAILCSGYTWSLDGKERDAGEPCIVLAKPWHARELLRRLREGLGEA
jgi:two-component system, cell cycle sensor histidine kinase and response regulator CckA